MDQYDIHVNLVMEFLKTNGYSASVISAHRICYKELRRYLASTHTSYTLSESLAWLENNQNAWTYRMYTSRRLCIYQLEDVYISGTVSPDHLGPHASAYTMLIPELQEELDDLLIMTNMYMEMAGTGFPVQDFILSPETCNYQYLAVKLRAIVRFSC